MPFASVKPLFGHKSGKKMGTHWVAFLKPNIVIRANPSTKDKL
jgi:hypothetical protein